MSKFVNAGCVILGAATAFFATGCDWSAGGSSDGFNTSRGAGINLNWSGVYNGINGSPAVQGTGIRNLTINQGGNTVEVIDSSGARYSGTVGSPGAVSDPNAVGAYSAGAELVQSQINFAGNGVEFVGVFHAVAVNEIVGNSSIDADASQNVDNDNTSSGTTKTTTVNNGKTTTTTTIFPVPGGTVTQIIIKDNETGAIISNTSETTVNDTDVDLEGDISTRSYTINEQNTQYRLEGTWIIDGGGAHGVDAISRGNAGTITFEEQGTVQAVPFDGQETDPIAPIIQTSTSGTP